MQARFFDCFLKGEDNGMRDVAPVRLEVRSTRARGACGPRRARLATARRTLVSAAPGAGRAARGAGSTRAATARFDASGRRRAVHLSGFPRLELAGPMKLRLHVELDGASDAHLFVAVSKGAIGGQRRAAVRRPVRLRLRRSGQRVAAHRSSSARRGAQRASPPVPPRRSTPSRCPTGEIAPVDIEILPSATYFARGDVLRLDVRGRWFWRRSMFRGMFPCEYAPARRRGDPSPR